MKRCCMGAYSFYGTDGELQRDAEAEIDAAAIDQIIADFARAELPFG